MSLEPVEEGQISHPSELGPYRIAHWNTYDVHGDRLSRVSSAMSWRRTAVGFWSAVGCGGLLTASAVSLFVPRVFGGGVSFGVLIGMFLIANRVYGRMKNGYLSTKVGQGQLDEDTVFVRLEIDGYEFARDVGHLSLDSNWLYFEGERTTFCLGPNNFDWKSLSPPISSQVGETDFHRIAGIRIPGRRETIGVFFESGMGGTGATLTAISDWKRVVQPTEGVVVIPPLQPLGPKGFSQSQKMAQTVAIGTAGFILTILGLVIYGVSNHAPSSLAVFLAFGGLGAVVIAQRQYVAYRRRKAFAHLKQIREELETRSSSAPLGR